MRISGIRPSDVLITHVPAYPRVWTHCRRHARDICLVFSIKGLPVYPPHFGRAEWGALALLLSAIASIYVSLRAYRGGFSRTSRRILYFWIISRSQGQHRARINPRASRRDCPRDVLIQLRPASRTTNRIGFKDYSHVAESLKNQTNGAPNRLSE
jgi:hypothetical protein